MKIRKEKEEDEIRTTAKMTLIYSVRVQGSQMNYIEINNYCFQTCPKSNANQKIFNSCVSGTLINEIVMILLSQHPPDQ